MSVAAIGDPEAMESQGCYRWNCPVVSPILGRPSRICPRVESSEGPDTMMHSPAVESSDESVESSEFFTRRINGLIELSRGKQRGI
jgi:hypothetical protein